MTQQKYLKLPQWAIENVVLLNVRLNEHLLIRMMLDTGAKYTIITPKVAEALDFDLAKAGQVPISTATQLERAALITLSQVDIHGFILTDIETAVLSLPTSLKVDGLIGMSFLRYCRIILDAPNRILELETEY